MDYTQSDANVTDGGTGHRMHQSTAPITTEVSSDDVNGLTWEALELIKAADLVPAPFDKTVPATYSQVRDAIAIMARKQSGAIASATGSADVLIGAYAPVVPALMNGLTLSLRPTYANATTAPTFTPHDGVIAAKAIVKGNGLTLVAGDIAGAGHWVGLRYDVTLDKWVLLNPAFGVGILPALIDPDKGAGMAGFGPDKAYPPNTVGNELNKRGRADNFQVDDFFRWANVQQDLKPIFVVGDSITEGANATDWKSDNYASILRRAVQSRYSNKNFGFANFDFVLFDAFPSATQYAHNCTRSGFGVVPAFQDSYFGGTMVQSNTIGDYVEITFTGRDARLVFVSDVVNGAVLDVTLDGAAVGSIDTKEVGYTLISGWSDGGVYSEVIHAADWGQHVVRLTNTENKPAKLCGMVYLEHGVGSPFGPTVFNLGRSSIALSDIPDTVLLGYASSATMILSLGVNDDIYAKPIATFRAKLTLLLAQVQALNGCVVVCDFLFSKPSSNVYKTALRELAYAYDFPYLDFGRLWSGASIVANQYTGFLSGDGVHPTDQGHEFIANTIMRTIGLTYDKGSISGRVGLASELVTPSGGWSNLGSGYANLGYSKTPDGLVTLEGLITSVGGAAAYSTIFTLPPGHRPSGTLIYMASFSHTLGELEIKANGDVCIGAFASIAGNFVSLSGIAFRADA